MHSFYVTVCKIIQKRNDDLIVYIIIISKLST